MASKLNRVLRAIKIQGYVTIRVGSRGAEHKVRKINVVDGQWVTDVMTEDLCGYVRIVKTKDAVVAQADYIIGNEAAITAKRAAEAQRATDWVMQS